MQRVVDGSNISRLERHWNMKVYSQTITCRFVYGGNILKGDVCTSLMYDIIEVELLTWG
jgi:hypothetical protein